MNQAEASRVNGAKSNGPATEAGKAISSRNARTHGLTGGDVVLPHESQEQYDRLLASYVDRFSPGDETEFDLLLEMVNSRWRLRRIESMEAALIQKHIDQQMQTMGEDADSVKAQALAYAELAENSKGMPLLNRYAKDLRRSYDKAFAKYMELRCGDLAQPPQAQLPQPQEEEPATDYSCLRNKPGYSNPAFMKALQPYIQKQQLAAQTKPPLKNAA